MGGFVTEEDAIWHVVIGSEQQGPLSRAQVLAAIHDQRASGGDLIWRPGFSDWKPISEVDDFWQPPKRASQPPPAPTPAERTEHDSDQFSAVPGKRKWSLWRAANVGLVVSVLPLALQIANGKGVEIASQAQALGVENIAYLGGQVLAGPLLFVLIAIIRNAFRRRLPSSGASVIEGSVLFAFLLICIGGALALYGQWFFNSGERISGATRNWMMGNIQSSCIRRQASLKQGAPLGDDQISKYCNCVSIQIADNTTYKRLVSDQTAPDVREYLKQQAEAAGQSCRVWVVP